MKILNLYAGIGGNRKFWGDTHEITAVEYDPKIAKIYKDFFPNDNVVVGDAHQYLIDHYSEFDFIWASPPCPSHSIVNHFLNAQGVIRYPDMSLYQEVLFLRHFFKGKYCIENVVPYYKPLIEPQYSGRHCFWANFPIPKLQSGPTIGKMCGENQGENRKLLQSTIGRFGPVKSLDGKRSNGKNHHKLGFDLTDKSHPNKGKLLNNCVAPEIGLAILESVIGIYNSNNVEQLGLFSQNT